MISQPVSTLFSYITLLFLAYLASSACVNSRSSSDKRTAGKDSSSRDGAASDLDSTFVTDLDSNIETNADSDSDPDENVLDASDTSVGEVDREGYADAGQESESDAGCDWELVFPDFGAQDLHAVWGSASDDVYAVGDFGTLLHYDGSGWTKVNIDTKVDLFDVWGSGKDDVYVVGRL